MALCRQEEENPIDSLIKDWNGRLRRIAAHPFRTDVSNLKQAAMAALMNSRDDGGRQEGRSVRVRFSERKPRMCV